MGRELASAACPLGHLADHRRLAAARGGLRLTNPTCSRGSSASSRVRLDRTTGEVLADAPLDVGLPRRSRTTSTRSSTSRRSQAGKHFLGRSRSASTWPPTRQSSRRSSPPGLRALLERDSVLPRRPGSPRHDPLGRARRADRGRARFLHSSDLDRGKPINWKRQARVQRRDGVMGDLGMHVAPPAAAARLDAARTSTRVLQDVVHERPRPGRRAGPRATPGTTPRSLHGRRESYPFPLARPAHRARETNTWSRVGMDGGVDVLDRKPEDPHASRSATAARSGSGSSSAASPRTPPSPARSSSSASPTRSCRCGPPSSTSSPTGGRWMQQPLLLRHAHRGASRLTFHLHRGAPESQQKVSTVPPRDGRGRTRAPLVPPARLRSGGSSRFGISPTRPSLAG